MRSGPSVEADPVGEKNEAGYQDEPAFEKKAPHQGGAPQFHEIQNDQPALDEGDSEHGENGAGAGDAHFTEPPGGAGGDEENEPGPVGGIQEKGAHRIT